MTKSQTAAARERLKGVASPYPSACVREEQLLREDNHKAYFTTILRYCRALLDRRHHLSI
jgi:hypothetical protein